MLLPISSIKPASDPIRKTWDEDKLNELAQSIAEQGLIVPIKVRPHPEVIGCTKHGFAALSKGQDWDDIDTQGDCLECGELLDKFWGELEFKWFEYEEGEIEPARPFEVVYGHRRLEAMRRNGATEIEAIVDGMDDTNALIQALIENIQREDMTDIDKGRTFLFLRENFGLTHRTIASRLGISPGVVGDCVSAVQDTTVKIFDHVHDQGEIADKSRIIRTGLKEIPEVKEATARKIIEERLSSRQSQRVVDSIAAAPSPEARKVLLETEYSPVIHDAENIKARAATFGAHDPFYRTDNGKMQQKAWDNTPEVKMIIDGVINAAKSWTMLIAEIRRMVEVGKMAPEGRQFTATKLRNLAQTLSSFADELEQEREREHA